MDKSTALVLKGFLELSPSQRDEFIREINKYLQGTTQHRVLEEALTKSIRGSTINFGPAPTGCPCCGK